MEENKRKSRKGIIIISIICLCIILGLSYFTFITYNKIENEKKLITKNKETISNLNKELENVKSEEKDLLVKIEALNNIDKETENIKKEVFSLASKLEKKIQDGTSKNKIAYLTFDDGPYNLTHSFLDVLDKYEVKATFFTIGYNKDKCFDDNSKDCSTIYKKIASKGHTLGNHTYNHLIFGGLYSSVDSFMYQVKQQENLIKNRTGVITNIVRLPGGSATAGGLKNGITAKLRENKYGWVDWTAQNGDGGAISDKNTAWNNFVSTIDNNIEVVLFHDYSTTTLSLLPDVITYLQKNNYIILPLFYESVMINK